MTTINFKVPVKVWRDPDTKAWLIYSKKYNISGYGTTKKRAKEMFDFTINEILIKTKPKPRKIK